MEEAGEVPPQRGRAERLDEGKDEEVDAGEHHGEDPVRDAQVALPEQEEHEGEGPEDRHLRGFR